MGRNLELHGHIRPEEFLEVFDGLMETLLISTALGDTGIFSPLADFIHVTGLRYEPGRRVEELMMEEIVKNFRPMIGGQEKKEVGKFDTFWGVKDFCEWGIIASHLGFSYGLNVDSLGLREFFPEGYDVNVPNIFNFELHHFDYEDKLKYTGFEAPSLPLDIIYFAQLNGFVNHLDGIILSDLYNRCRIPDFEERVDEARRSLTPRKTHSTEQVREYLGPKLEATISRYCREEFYDYATQILYRRNRVKKFLGGDIKIPTILVQKDDEEFSGLDPREIRKKIDSRMGVFNPLVSHMLIPVERLTPKQQRLYFTVAETMKYVRRGALTYDTPEKIAMLTSRDVPCLKLASHFLLPEPTES